MGTRPFIGITPGFLNDSDRIQIPRGYIDAVNNAGGFAVVLPLNMGQEMLEETVERFDGFLLSGGPDLDARSYGEENRKCNGEISPYRDSMEIKLTKAAAERGKPLFGICRGIQVLNVALGGTLYQDIYLQNKDREFLKHWQEAPGWYAVHDVKVQDGSRLREYFHTETLAVNSFHHQAVKDAGKGLKATAVSSDGVIEAIEHESLKFAVGVQWHPELMWEKDGEWLKLFRSFVSACTPNL